MRAILVPTGGMPREVEVEGLRGLQEAVGGYIESCSWIFDDAPAVYANEEGKLACIPNRAIYATEAQEGAMKMDGSIVKAGDLLEIVFGDFVCVGFDPETGEDRDITDEEAARVQARFGSSESIASGIAEVMRIRQGL